MIFLFLLAETLLSPFVAIGVILSFLFSHRRNVLKTLASEMFERLGGLEEQGRVKLLGRDVWWFHAASAGEVSGLSPLISLLHSRDNAPAILITTMTVAGREAAKRNPYVSWAQLAPIDAWPFVIRFVHQVNASRLILTETELWPALIFVAHQTGLELALINARLTPNSLRHYHLFSWVLRPIFQKIPIVFTQSPEDRDRFVSLGFESNRLLVAGNTKYDFPINTTNKLAREFIARTGWQDKPLFIAGSTHLVEEEIVIDAYLKALALRPHLKLVIAPRHIERIDTLLALMKVRQLNYLRWSDLQPINNDTHILVIDMMGVLPSLWPAATIGFVGGTLIPVGGHNLLEPAEAGVPVLFGPHTEHIARPAALLENHGGLRVTEATLGSVLCELLLDPERTKEIGHAARHTAQQLRGASAVIIDRLLVTSPHAGK